MPETAGAQIAVIGIDIGKNSFHVVGHDSRGAIVLRQKWSRSRSRLGSPTCRHVSLAWRPAWARITWPASSRCLVMTLA